MEESFIAIRGVFFEMCHAKESSVGKGAFQRYDITHVISSNIEMIVGVKDN